MLKRVHRHSNIVRSSRTGSHRSSALPINILRLSEACCILTCLYITARSIRERRVQEREQEQWQEADLKRNKQQTRKSVAPQPSLINPLTLHDHNATYVSLLLALALALRFAADFLSSLIKASSPSTSLDAAARLARLEAVVSEQSRSLEAAQRAVDKARLRYDLYSAEIKQPVRALQSSQMDHAAVLTKVATEIATIKDQARGHEQVLSLQQELVGRLVSTMMMKRKEYRSQGPSEGTVVVEPQPATTSSLPPPDPWTFRGDPG